MKTEHLPFYLMGRDSKALRVDTDDVLDEIVKRIEGGTAVHIAIWDVVTENAESFKSDRAKRAMFVRDVEDEIKEAGGDQQAAWEAFVQGKIDDLAFRLDEAVIEDLEGDDDDGDDDEEDEEDDEVDPEEAE